MAKEVNLMKLSMREANIFKIKNRKGFAVICKDNLTEGATIPQAIDRMNKVLKRTGCTLG